MFDEHTKQIDFYKETAFPLLDIYLKGHNTTILAYGQTGSGKTSTMGTNIESAYIRSDSDFIGITPRLLTDIFLRINKYNYLCKLLRTL